MLFRSRALEARGDSVAVITRGKKDVDRRFADAGFIPGRLPLKGLLDFVSPTTLARVLNRMSAPIVVHVHNFKDADTAIRARNMCKDPGNVRLVMTRHLARPAKTGRYHRWLYAGLDSIIFVSEAAKAEFLSTNPAVDHKKLHVVHNAITAPENVEPAAGKEAGEIRLVFAGRLAPEKGLDILIQALAKIKDRKHLRLKIAGVGRGRDVMPLMGLARRLDVADNIEWLGPVDKIFPLMASADIGVLPSIVKEACPLAPLEFMSQGIPVIASACGGTPELITDGQEGLLVPPGDADALAAAIEKLAADPELRHRLGANARKAYQTNLSYPAFFTAITEHYLADER